MARYSQGHGFHEPHDGSACSAFKKMITLRLNQNSTGSRMNAGIKTNVAMRPAVKMRSTASPRKFDLPNVVLRNRLAVNDRL